MADASEETGLGLPWGRVRLRGHPLPAPPAAQSNTRGQLFPTRTPHSAEPPIKREGRLSRSLIGHLLHTPPTHVTFGAPKTQAPHYPHFGWEVAAQ